MILRLLARVPFIAMLLTLATNAFADHREKTPENIAYWHTEGPWVIFKLCVITAIIVMIIIALIIIRSRTRKDP